MKKRQREISSAALDALRKAFVDSGLSIKRWSIQSGVPYASVHSVANGERDATATTMSKLATALGFELVLRPIRRKGKA